MSPRLLTFIVIISAAAVTVGIATNGRQEPIPGPIDVVSVKRNVSGETTSSFNVSPNGLQLTNVELRRLIARAFDIEVTMMDHVLKGGPAPLMSLRFDVAAKTARAVSRDQEPSLLRTILTSRFGLQTHREVKTANVYSMRVARQGRLGPQLRPSKIDCPALFSEGRHVGQDAPQDPDGQPLCLKTADYGIPAPELSLRHHSSISELARRAQGFVDLPLVNDTGLSGSYEWSLRFSLAPQESGNAVSIYTAFVEQLGLKLTVRQAPIDVVVIDRLILPEPD